MERKLEGILNMFSQPYQAVSFSLGIRGQKRSLFIYLNVMFPYMKKIVLKENGSLSFSTLKRTAHKQ